MKVLLVDFDGTLTDQDTNRVLIVSLLKVRPWRLILVLADLVKLKVLPLSADRIQTVKNRCVARLLSGLTLALLDKCLGYYVFNCRNMFRLLIVDTIKAQAGAGIQVLVVTASMQQAVAKAVADLPVHVIGANFPLAGDRFTGESPAQTCYGKTKAEAIQRWAAAQDAVPDFDGAWSDSLSDLPMMRLAEKRFWVCKETDQSAFHAADPEGKVVVVGLRGARGVQKRFTGKIYSPRIVHEIPKK